MCLEIDNTYVLEFKNQYKKFCNKYQGFDKDFEILLKALKVEPENRRICEKIPTGREVEIPLYKVKKFQCKAIQKGTRSGIRLIYAYDKYKYKIYLVELYKHIKDSNSHDIKRIKKYFKTTQYEYCETDC
jgi:mRNA-degrading endonuclease RelE of RelBE toxin-antitoxin system